MALFIGVNAVCFLLFEYLCLFLSIRIQYFQFSIMQKYLLTQNACIYIYMAESFCFSPETDTTLLIGSCMRAKLLQLCLTLCDPMDYSPPGFSVHGIFQARILEWVAMLSSRGSSWTRDWTHIFCISSIGWWILYHCITWEPSIDSIIRLILIPISFLLLFP